MKVTREKIAKALRFEITAPLGMGLSKGDAGLGAFENDLSPWLRFTICPPNFPDRQEIWLVSKDEQRDETKRLQYDRKTSRQLTSEVKGSLSFVMGRLAIIEEPSDVPSSTIGTLSHGPAYENPDYGHAEFYSIEINLDEKDFDHIRHIFLSGRLPSGITIWTPDVEYGYAPDGSDTLWEVWETTHSTFAKITGFSVAFSMDIPRVGIGFEKTENEEESEREEREKVRTAMLHSREDIQLLCYQVSALNEYFGKFRRQMSLLILIAVAIAVVCALHLKF